MSRFQMIPLLFYNQHLGDHQIWLQKNMQTTKNVFTKGMQKIKDFGNWLLNYIPPKPKVVDKVLESFKNKIIKMYEKRDTSFQLKESKSALKKFAIQYRIDG